MIVDLDAGLATEEELETKTWTTGYQDNWSVERANALE